jgi:predicted kinase
MKRGPGGNVDGTLDVENSGPAGRPRLILVAGVPASGKTTIAHRLARAMRLPLICKDTLKESLFDHLGTGDRGWSRRLGYAVVQAMYALAGEILAAGASLILESTFVHPDTPGEVRELIQATGARLSVVYCHAAPEVLAARFTARARTDRHPSHLDETTATPATFAGGRWPDRPAYPGQVIDVDTTDFDAVDIDAIVRRVQGCG